MVRPVVGVILMVAITVVLAAVVFVLVSNIGKDAQNSWCNEPNKAVATKETRQANVTLHKDMTDEYVIIVKQAKWDCKAPNGDVAYSTWIDVGETEPRKNNTGQTTPGFELVALVGAIATATVLVRRQH